MVELLSQAKEKSVAFNEKELFILANKAHADQAVLALSVGKLGKVIGASDGILASSMELLKLHSDYFTDYSLTSGKSSAAITIFKSNMQALSDKSKMFG